METVSCLKPQLNCIVFMLRSVWQQLSAHETNFKGTVAKEKLLMLKIPLSLCILVSFISSLVPHKQLKVRLQC